MAQKVMVTLVDDLDGSTAEETVEFGLDGASYQIDLSSDNADRLRQARAARVAASALSAAHLAGGRAPRPPTASRTRQFAIGLASRV